MKAEPQKQHEWLQQLVGEWTYEGEAAMGPDRPPEPFGGTETVRSLGGLWFVAEGAGTMPGGDPARTIMTLGYDPEQGRYVGTWIGSMATHLWVYDHGELDTERNALTLEADGPMLGAEGKTTRYRDEIQFNGDDHRVLTAYMQEEDGSWRHLMTVSYRRKG